MSDAALAILTASLTIVGSIIVFVVGQIIGKFFIDPIHGLASLIGEIADSIIFYANVISSPELHPSERLADASRQFRQQASQLMARSHAIPWYGLMQFLRIVPKHKDVVIARQNLIGLSNCLKEGCSDANEKRKTEIVKSLQLRI